MNQQSLRPNLVTDPQRDRAVDYLQQAYAAGALDEDAFDDRLAQALTASNRSELNASLRGIARIASASTGTLVPAPLAKPPVHQGVHNVGAGLVHLAGIPTGFIAPAITKAASVPGTRIWWEASRALSWQVTAMFAMMAAVLGAIVLGTGELVLLGGLAWFIGTLVFSIRAFNGDDSTGALGRLMLFRPEQPPRR